MSSSKKNFFFWFLLLLANASFAQTDQFRLWGSTSTNGQTAGYGAIFNVNTDGSDFTIVKEFASNPEGSVPQGALFEASNGKLYGMSSEGGVNDWGVIYQLNADGTGYTKLFDFSETIGGVPKGKLIDGGDGKLYGMTQYGAKGYGIVFKINPDGTGFVKIHEFDYSHGAWPRGDLLKSSDGNFYGMTSGGGSNTWGTVFKINSDGSVFEVLKNFGPLDEQSPDGNVIEGLDGKLYGIVSGTGTIFSINKDGSDFINLHKLARQSKGSLIQLGNGDLIGLSTYDGDFSQGTLFKIQPDGNGFTILFSFPNLPTGTMFLGNDGKLYGLLQTMIFRIDTDGTNFEQVPFSGRSPNSLSQTSTGDFFGVTARGGASNNGTVFKFSSGVVTILKDFPQEGADIESSYLQGADGKIYGSTTRGGAYGLGILFSINKDGSGYSKFFDFNDANQCALKGRLLQLPDGFIYGIATTTSGVTSDKSLIFKIRPDGSSFSIVNNFNKELTGQWILASDNQLYLTSSKEENPTAYGEIIKMDPTSGAYSSLYDFSANPIASGTKPFAIMEGSDGFLYGITNRDGINEYGTLFKLAKNGSGFLKFADFDVANIGNFFTKNGLIEASDGKLYGSLFLPFGANQSASIYRVNKDGSQFEDVYLFQNQSFGISENLIELPDGKFYGMGSDNYILSLEKNGVLNKIFTLPHGPGSFAQLTAVKMQAQTISFQPITNKIVGTTPFQITATASSGLPVAFTSSDNSVAAVNGDQVTIIGAGTVTITAQSGSMNVATAVATQTFTITKGSQVITFDPLPAKKVTDSPFTISASNSAGLPIIFTSDNAAVATISGNTITITGVGTALIKANSAGNVNYDAAPEVSQTLTVNKADQTITFNSLPVKNFLDAPFTISASNSAALPIVFTSDNTAVATISGNTITIVGAGTALIRANSSGNANYNAAPEASQTLTVNKADQVITFNSLPVKKFLDAPFSISASNSAGLPVIFTSDNTAVATITSNTVTIVSAGTAHLKANSAGNSNYNAATEVSQTLTVNKEDQLITFGAIANKTLGDAAFTISATASSGKQVQFTTASDKVTITGTSVSIIKAGSVTINATQIGDGNYNPAPAVPQTFCINPAKPTILASGNTILPLLTSNSATGNQWFRNGTPISGATSNSYAVTQDGIYTVVVTVDNCVSETSGGVTVVVTGDLHSSSDIFIYPNPAKDKIFLNGKKFDQTKSIEISIYDTSGKLVDYLVANGENISIPLTSYAAGLYLVKAWQNGVFYSEKFVKE